MKLLNKLITKTAIYKHLKDLYEQALKDVEALQEDARKDCKDIQELKNLLSKSDSELLELKGKYDKLFNDYVELNKSDYTIEIRQLKNECNRLKTLLATEKSLTDINTQLKIREFEQNYNKLLESNKNERELTKELKQDITNKLKLIRKIRTHANKLDKKDENVKEIKRLIKEVL